jgi:2-oxo-3-hexenedioate decarboxylase
MAVTSAEIAATILAALDGKGSIKPITADDAGFDIEAAYRVADALLAARIARGETPVGWKLGFTNRTIWDEYGVHAPIWGPIYDRTVIHVAGEAAGPVLSAAAFVQPRIEPEIVFRIARLPRADMEEHELLGCVDAAGHGFEIVQSVYPGWRFRAADTVAAFAMHGALVCGPLMRIDDAGRWRRALETFEISLLCNGETVDRGVAANVLGGPLKALRHFVAELESRPMTRGIAAGDLITTGTVTRAFPVENSETWTTRIDGLPLAGMKLTFDPAP